MNIQPKIQILIGLDYLYTRWKYVFPRLCAHFPPICAANALWPKLQKSSKNSCRLFFDLLNKRQNHEGDFFKLCLLLKKSELKKTKTRGSNLTNILSKDTVHFENQTFAILACHYFKRILQNLSLTIKLETPQSNWIMFITWAKFLTYISFHNGDF